MTDQGPSSRDRATCPVHFSAGLNLERPPKDRSESLGSAIIESAFADPKIDCTNCIEEVGLLCPLKDSIVTVELLQRITEQVEAITIISRLQRLLTSNKSQRRAPIDKLSGYVLNRIGFTQQPDLVMDQSELAPYPNSVADSARHREDKGDEDISFKGLVETQRGVDIEVARDIGY